MIVRARDEPDIARLTAAGATEVVPEAFESGVMLASHTLVVVGVPLQPRDAPGEPGARRAVQPAARPFPGGARRRRARSTRLHAVTLEPRARMPSVGAARRELDLGVQVRAVRRPGARRGSRRPRPARCRPGDIVVLLGAPERLLAAEEKLLRG